MTPILLSKDLEKGLKQSPSGGDAGGTEEHSLGTGKSEIIS